MPLTTTANFDTANALAVRKPVAIIEFDSITTKFCSATFGDITGNHKKYLLPDIQYELQSVFPDEPRTEFGTLDFSIVDKDGDLTTILKNDTFTGKEVTCKVGFQSLDDVDFVTLPLAYVVDAQVNDDGITFSFSCRMTGFDLNRELFSGIPSSFLAADITAAATSLTIDDSTNFLMDGGATIPFWANTFSTTLSYIQVDSEIMTYTSITNGSPDTLNTLTRGSFGTKATTHVKGAEVKQLYTFLGDVSSFGEIIASLLVSGTGSSNGIYDVSSLVAGFGLGISEDLINIDNIIYQLQRSVGGDFFIYSKLSSLVSKPERAIDFFERTVFNTIKPAYFYVNGDGELDVNLPDPVFDVSGSETLTDATTIGLPDIDIKYTDLVTQINLNNGFNVVSAKAIRFIQYTLDEAVTGFGTHEKNIQWFDSQVTSLADDEKEIYMLRRYFWLYGNQGVELILRSMHKRLTYQVGDIPVLTNSNIPDFVNGGDGISNIDSFIYGKRMNLLEDVEFRVRIFNAFADGTDPIDAKNTVTPQDTSMAETADPGADYDNTGNLHPGLIYFAKVTLTRPNFGSSERQYISIVIKAIDGGNTDTFFYYFAYDPSLSGDVVMYFPFYNQDESVRTLDNVYVNWAQSSGSASQKPSTVICDEIILVTSNFTISRV